ncbi:MAG: hypothetical protein QM784_21820 [Polyangiaceae bacterium]
MSLTVLPSPDVSLPDLLGGKRIERHLRQYVALTAVTNTNWVRCKPLAIGRDATSLTARRYT